jgi:hypothetical protein
MATTDAPQVVLTSALGYDRIRPALRRGRLVRVRRGAYAGQDRADWSHRQMVLARCISIASQLSLPFAFSHETAAVLHRLPSTTKEPTTHISQLTTRSSRSARDIRRHVTTDLDDVVEIDGLPVTSLERTALDTALTPDPLTGLIHADAALGRLARVDRFKQAASTARMELMRSSLLQRLHDRGPVRHCRVGRAVLTHANGFAESPGETWSRWLSLSRGLPAPVLQHEVFTASGWYFTDLAWLMEVDGRPWRVFVEYDGQVKYAGTGAAVHRVLRKEQLREEDLRDAGMSGTVRVVRFDIEDWRHQDAAFARLLRTFPPGTAGRVLPVTELQRQPR